MRDDNRDIPNWLLALGLVVAALFWVPFFVAVLK